MDEKILLQKSLRNFWDEVIPLTLAEGQKLYAEFCSKCIHLEFQNKFYKDSNLNKPITKRYFKKTRIISLDDDICDHLYIKNKSLEVYVLWGKFNDPMAFYLKGRPTKFGKIFITEGDALAKIIYDIKNEYYLFLDGYRENLFEVC